MNDLREKMNAVILTAFVLAESSPLTPAGVQQEMPEPADALALPAIAPLPPICTWEGPWIICPDAPHE